MQWNASLVERGMLSKQENRREGKKKRQKQYGLFEGHTDKMIKLHLE